jgi:hypothetical protein
MEIANVLIAEHGADWSNWSSPFAATGRTLVVFVQQPDESKLEFRRRVERRIERLKMKAAAWFFLGGKGKKAKRKATGSDP